MFDTGVLSDPSASLFHTRNADRHCVGHDAGVGLERDRRVFEDTAEQSVGEFK